MLLLDEPLGALDKKLREEMQIELRQLQRTVGITFVFVTHDQEEALTLSDRIAVMSSGKVLQIDTAARLYEAPNCREVAEFIGTMNFLPGEMSMVSAEIAEVRTATLGMLRAKLGSPAPSAGSEVAVAVRPEKLRLHWQHPHGEANVLAGRVGRRRLFRRSQPLLCRGRRHRQAVRRLGPKTPPVPAAMPMPCRGLSGSASIPTPRSFLRSSYAITL